MATKDLEFFAQLERGKQFTRRNFKKCLIAMLQRQGYDVVGYADQKDTKLLFVVMDKNFVECVVAALKQMDYKVDDIPDSIRLTISRGDIVEICLATPDIVRVRLI